MRVTHPGAVFKKVYPLRNSLPGTVLKPRRDSAPRWDLLPGPEKRRNPVKRHLSWGPGKRRNPVKRHLLGTPGGGAGTCRYTTRVP